MDPRIRDVLDRLQALGFDGLGPTDDPKEALIAIAERSVASATHKQSPAAEIALIAIAVASMIDALGR